MRVESDKMLLGQIHSLKCSVTERDIKLQCPAEHLKGATDQVYTFILFFNILAMLSWDQEKCKMLKRHSDT